jgi:hypothetical protein
VDESGRSSGRRKRSPDFFVSCRKRFTDEQLAMVVAASGEIHDGAPTSPDGLRPGTEAWILGFAVRTARAPQATGLGPIPGSPPRLAEDFYLVAFWLSNTRGGCST